MITVGKTDHVNLTGWPAVSVLLALMTTRVLTILVISSPIAWLINHVFAASAIRAIFGADHFSYWRCVGLFAIWHSARVRIKISGLAQIKMEGDL